MQRSTEAPATTTAARTGHPRKALPGSPHCTLGIGALGICLLMSAGCGGHGSRVALPTTKPPAAPPMGSSLPPVSAPATTAKNAVIAAYTGFFPAADQALKAPPEQIKPILKDYATGWYLDFEIRQMVDQQAQHLEPWGHVVAHITKIELQQSTATVHDCQDASNAGLANAQTHQLIPTSRGTSHRNLTATLTLGSDRRWRLTDLKQFKAQCHAS